MGTHCRRPLQWAKFKIARTLLSTGAQVDPPGLTWEELLVSIESVELYGKEKTRRLREFQADPEGYLASHMHKADRPDYDLALKEVSKI